MKEFNPKNAKRGARISDKRTKVQVTIRIDADVLNWLVKRAESTRVPYQTMLNALLAERMTLEQHGLIAGAGVTGTMMIDEHGSSERKKRA